MTEDIDLLLEAGFSVEETLDSVRRIIKRDGLGPLIPEELRALVKSKHKRHRLKELSLKKRFNAEELMKEEFPPLSFIIERILPEGLTILAGKPKTAKTWLTLQLAIAKPEGRKALGRWPTSSGEVIYYALEDAMTT